MFETGIAEVAFAPDRAVFNRLFPQIKGWRYDWLAEWLQDGGAIVVDGRDWIDVPHDLVSYAPDHKPGCFTDDKIIAFKYNPITGRLYALYSVECVEECTYEDIPF